MIQRSLLKRNLMFLYSLAGFGMFGHVLYNPLIPIFARRVGASGLEVGLLTSGFMLARAITSFIIGKSTDIYPQGKTFVQIGIFFMIFTALGYALVSTYPGILLLRFVQGILSGMTWPVTQIMVVKTAGKSIKARALSLYQISGRIGALLSRVCLSIILVITTGLAMGEIAQFRIVFIAGAIVFCFGFLDVLFIKEPRPETQQIKTKHAPYPIFILGFLFGAMLAIGPLSIVFLNEYFNLDPVNIAIVLLGLDIITMVFMYIYSHVSDRSGSHTSLIMMLVPCLLAAIALPFARHIALFIILYFITRLSLSSFLPVSRAYATDFSSGIGLNLGTLNMMSNLGSVVGPLVAGLLYDRCMGSFKIAGYAVFAILLIPAGIIAIYPVLMKKGTH